MRAVFIFPRGPVSAREPRTLRVVPSRPPFSRYSCKSACPDPRAKFISRVEYTIGVICKSRSDFIGGDGTLNRCVKRKFLAEKL